MVVEVAESLGIRLDNLDFSDMYKDDNNMYKDDNNMYKDDNNVYPEMKEDKNLHLEVEEDIKVQPKEGAFSKLKVKDIKDLEIVVEGNRNKSTFAEGSTENNQAITSGPRELDTVTSIADSGAPSVNETFIDINNIEVVLADGPAEYNGNTTIKMPLENQSPSLQGSQIATDKNVTNLSIEERSLGDFLKVCDRKTKDQAKPKPYKCDVCGHETSQKGNLKTHKITKHQYQPTKKPRNMRIMYNTVNQAFENIQPVNQIQSSVDLTNVRAQSYNPQRNSLPQTVVFGNANSGTGRPSQVDLSRLRNKEIPSRPLNTHTRQALPQKITFGNADSGRERPSQVDLSRLGTKEIPTRPLSTPTRAVNTPSRAVSTPTRQAPPQKMAFANIQSKVNGLQKPFTVLNEDFVAT